jgi:Rrf2 family protein
MRLTSQEEYGLRCLLQVARARGAPTSIRSIAAGEGISTEYAAKLMGVLRKAGLVRSQRGAGGGYHLVRPPNEVSVWSVLTVLDNPLYDGDFCTGHSGQLAACVHQPSCSVKVLWSWLGDAIEAALARLTLADLLDGVEPTADVLGTLGGAAGLMAAAADLPLSIDAASGLAQSGVDP